MLALSITRLIFGLSIPVSPIIDGPFHLIRATLSDIVSTIVRGLFQSAELLPKAHRLLKISLQFPVAQVHLDVFKLLDERFERRLDVLNVRQAYIAPNRIRTLGQARDVAKTGGRQLKRQKIFRTLLGDQAGKARGKELR